MPGRDQLPLRRVALEYPDDLDPCWNRRFPEFAHAANGISLLMPYAEPYFVRSARSALDQLDDPLRTQTRAYIDQEREHHRQHRRFNDLVAARYPGIGRIEQWMRRTYGWLGRTRSQRFNLAFAAGSETIAFALARWVEKHAGQLFTDADAEPATLFMWHLAEEIEHKSAAFEVYEAVDGSRVRYAAASAISLVLLMWFTWISALVMLRGERRLHSPVAHFRLLRWSLSISFTVLPMLASSALPGHHPRSFADPVWLPAWLETFDSDTGTLAVPFGTSTPERPEG
jgi:hypothetical protein